MKNNEPKQNASPGNDGDRPDTTVPKVEDDKSNPVTPTPTNTPSTPNAGWSPPEVQASRSAAPQGEKPAPVVPSDPKTVPAAPADKPTADDPVDDRNGRAPNKRSS
jgi:hypothetical protein